MIDIHCHILPGVDDGPLGMEETRQILAEAQKAGVKTIIATPHYSHGLYENGMVGQVFDRVKTEAKNYGIELYRGYEIKIHQYPARMPDDYRDLDLAGSKYILMELLFKDFPSYTFDLIYQLQINGFTVIIAHPERCRKLAAEKRIFEDMYDNGCLMQIDAASIIGVNGWGARLFAKEIIRSHKAAFVASDAHDPEDYSKYYVEAYKRVQKWVGRDAAEGLFGKNAQKIIECISGCIENVTATP